MPAEPHTDDRRPRLAAGLLPVVLAVFWSFFGVRKGRKLVEDAGSIKPLHLIAAGLMGALLFVLALILIVRIVIANA